MRCPRILIVDYGFAKTHRRFNLKYFKLLSEFATICIANSNHYYDELKDSSKVDLVDVHIDTEFQYKQFKFKHLKSIEIRLWVISNMLKTNKYLINNLKKKPDFILIMGFEIITFSLFRWLLPKDVPIFLFQHQQIDELDNSVKKYFFDRFKNKVHHITLEEIFSNYLIKNQKVNKKNIHIVHDLVEINNNRNFNNQKKTFILGISGNNDESIIKNLIEDEKHEKFLEKLNIKMILRSKIISYEDEYLVVTNRYYSDSEYDELYNKADIILAAAPKSFKYRLSGPVIDAIENQKLIIGSDIPHIVMYQKNFPSIFKVFRNYEELRHILNSFISDVNESELLNLQKRHSKEVVLKELKDCFL